MKGIQMSGPPTAFPRDLGIYQQMGEQNIRLMLKDFYTHLLSSEIKEMFLNDLEESANRSADFFIFLLGGPPVYHQKHGHPRMKQRHIPFKIDEKAQLEWFKCFEKVLENEEKYHFPKEHKNAFLKFIFEFSKWMINS